MEEDNLSSGKSDRLLIKALCFVYRMGRSFHYSYMQLSENFQKQKHNNVGWPTQDEQIYFSCVKNLTRKQWDNKDPVRIVLHAN